MASVIRTCRCGKKFEARLVDIKRGWAKSCSKSCAAKKREKENDHQYVRRVHIDDNERMHAAAMDTVESGWDGHKNVW